MTFSKEIERAIGYAAATYEYEDYDAEDCVEMALTGIGIEIESISDSDKEYLTMAVCEYARKLDAAMEPVVDDDKDNDDEDDEEDDEDDTWDADEDE